MTVDELYKIFLMHRHTGNTNDGQMILYTISQQTVVYDYLILVAPNGTKFKLEVDNDGALKTTQI
jgi:hypothetical protein